MSESGLSIGYPELISEAGHFLGYGYKAYADYTAPRKAHLNRIVQAGVRRVYYPMALDASTVGYEWSWLQPTTTLAVVSGTSDYDLPDDFGRLIGSLHYPAETYRTSIPEVPVSTILAARAFSALTGYPSIAAVRWKTTDGTSGQRQEILFDPEPDGDWALSYEYEAYNGALSSDNPYPLGGMKLAELYIESCLAVAESKDDDELGIHTQTFRALLVDQIARDRKNGALYYGHMGDKEPGRNAFRRGYAGSPYRYEYKGVVY